MLQALQVKTRRAPGVGDSPWATFHSDSVAVSLKPLAFRKGLVPNVRGMGAKAAVYALEQSGLRVRMEGVGHVYYQSILPGSRVSKGAAVVIRLRYLLIITTRSLHRRFPNLNCYETGKTA